MKLKSNLNNARNTFLLLSIMTAVCFVVAFIYLIVEMLGNRDANAMQNEITIITIILLIITIAFLVIFAVTNAEVNNKKKIIQEGNKVQAKIEKISEPNFGDRFVLAGNSPSKYIAFRITACDYDESGNCKRKYISDLIQGAHASKVTKTLESKNIDTITVYVDPNNPNEYTFDLDEIESFLKD